MNRASKRAKLKIWLRRMIIQWVIFLRQWERRDTGRINLRQEKYLFHLDKRKRSKDEYIKRQVCRLKMR